MDSSKTRRKPVTYGRQNRRFQAQNIFDVSSEAQLPDSVFASLPTEKPRQPSAEKRRLDNVKDQNKDRILDPPNHLEEPEGGTSSSADGSPDTSDSSSSNSPSAMKNQNKSALLFEILSSDEDSNNQGLAHPENKRRKLATGRTRETIGKTSQSSSRSTNADPKPVKFIVSKPKHRVDKLKERREQHQFLEHSSKPQVRRRIPTIREINSSDSRTNEAPQKNIMRSKDDPSSSEPTSPVSLTPKRRRESRSPQQSDQSSKSSPAAQRTPKQERLLSTVALSSDGASTPSRLGLKSLRLTPEKGTTAADEKIAAIDVYSTQLTPRRGRQRLVDRLDSPRRAVQSDQSRSQKGKPEEDHLWKDLDVENRKQKSLRYRPQSDGEEVAEGASGVETSRNSSIRPKITYAQERSHLSDMIFQDLADRSVPSTHQVAQAAPSQINSFSALNSQLELEDPESDDPSGGANLKSIHELRQAGANNRVDRELEIIFEDIGTGSSSSPSLRLQALMQLLHKLGDGDFFRRFVDSGMGLQLTTITDEGFDTLSAILVTFTLSILGDAEGGSVSTLTQIHQAVTYFSPILLGEKRSFTEVVKDGKRYLSKSLIRDLLGLETALLSHPIWHDRRPTQLTPGSVALASLEIIMQKLRKLKDTTVTLGRPGFKGLLVLLDDCVRKINKGNDQGDTIVVVKRALSTLECACISPDFSMRMEKDDLGLLGRLLAETLNHAGEKDVDLEQALLRLMVSLSNNRSDVCETLASTAVIDSISAVIENNYLQLATCVDQGAALNQEKLDSVILALGCLLNFADCSDSARQNIHRAGKERGKGIDWLVTTFNDRVGKAIEATTVDQSQVLVGFGYLSILLCTLCLNGDIRQYITGRLNGQTLNDLCVASETFLGYLQQIENFDSGDKAMSNFTERFGTILATVAIAGGLI